MSEIEYLGGERTNRRGAASYMLSGLLRNKGVTILALILTVVSTFLLTVPMVIVGIAIDELAISGLSTQFVIYVWEIVILTALYMGLYFVVGYIWAIVTLRWERDARQEFFEALQEYSMTFHDQIDSKRILSIAMQDIRWVRFSLNPALRNLAGGLAQFAITGAFLASVDLLPSMIGFLSIGGISIPGLTLTMVIGAPLYLAFAYRYANAVEPIRRKRSEDMERLTSISQGVFRGIEVVRAFGAEDREEEKFRKASEEYKESVAREGKLAAFYIPALVLTGMTALAFFYGGFAVISGALTVGGLIQVLTLLSALVGLNFLLPRMLLVLRGGYVNAQRVVDILNWEDPMIEPPEEPKDFDWTEDIVFDNVSFQYGVENDNGHHYALKNINLTIPGGSRVALIGGPGGGKSTILKLLLRLYDPTEGEIRIGDKQLQYARTETVRDAVGLVEQDVFLFRMSIRENIAFGNKNASLEEVKQAAKRAQAHEFIKELPEQYDSLIGERGMTLSGGQRQRLAIARALIQDPKILLLDDSVSAVDAQTEYLLRQALEEVMAGRTSITVTQRLRTLLESDLVVIVDKGQLVDVGSHDELMRKSDQYRRIFERLPGARQLLDTIATQGGAA